jgi:hypothetical protein
MILMTKIAATASYRDTYAGVVGARLIAFKTKRRGETVTRFRWEQDNGQGCGYVAGGFVTVDGACVAAQRNQLFSNVAAA